MSAEDGKVGMDGGGGSNRQTVITYTVRHSTDSFSACSVSEVIWACPASRKKRGFAVWIAARICADRDQTLGEPGARSRNGSGTAEQPDRRADRRGSIVFFRDAPEGGEAWQNFSEMQGGRGKQQAWPYCGTHVAFQTARSDGCETWSQHTHFGTSGMWGAVGANAAFGCRQRPFHSSMICRRVRESRKRHDDGQDDVTDKLQTELRAGQDKLAFRQNEKSNNIIHNPVVMLSRTQSRRP
jgi:hypothetical protein